MSHAVAEFIRALDMAQRMAAAGRAGEALDEMLDRAERWLQEVDAELAAREAQGGAEAIASAMALRMRLDRVRWALQRGNTC